MAQFEFVSWLARWLFEIDNFEFDWDQGNSSKNLQKHKITLESAERFFRNKECLVPLGIQTLPKANEPRFGALGMDLNGNKLSVCFTIREGHIRVISIRVMSLKERSMYASLRKE